MTFIEIEDHYVNPDRILYFRGGNECTEVVFTDERTLILPVPLDDFTLALRRGVGV